MHIETEYFLSCKKAGKVKKTDKMAAFHNGLCHLTRRLWYNNDNHRFYVMLGGEAYPARLSSGSDLYYDLLDTVTVYI